MNKRKRKKENNGYMKSIIISFSVVLLIILIVILCLTSSNDKVRFFSTLIVGLFFSIFSFVAGIIIILPNSGRDKSIKNIIIALCTSVLLILFSILMMSIFSNYIKDIPNVINSDYKVAEGNLTSYYVGGGSTKKGKGTRFVINGIEFYTTMRYNGFLVVGDKYRVEYLPHSKTVMKLYRYKK